jgi:N-acetylglucosamine-6-phosphate deacetylase
MNRFVRDALGGPGFELLRGPTGPELRPLSPAEVPVAALSGAAGLWLTPGWFDLQINGFAGIDPNAPGLTGEALARMTARLLYEGVSGYLVTLITNTHEQLLAAAAAVADARSSDPQLLHAVAGVHLEGPFISPIDGARGAHPLAGVRDADLGFFDEIAAAAAGAVRLVTLAPEVPGAIGLIEALVARGIVVAIGHTLADGDTIRRAVDAGARLSTHLGNGAPATLPRHPNLIWEQLAEDRLWASVIFDSHHLPTSVMRVLARVKGADRLILTSDAVALARMAPGVYEAAVGGQVELSASGRLTLAGTPYLAGSASSLLDGVNVAVQRVGMPLEAALRCASRNPRALLGIDNDDLTIIENRGREGVAVVGVRVQGRWLVDPMRA